METITKTFYDVEHGGDADQIKEIIRENDGKILREKHDYNAEILMLEFEVPDKTKFWEAVKGEYWFD